MKSKILWHACLALLMAVNLHAQLGLGNGRIKGTISDESGQRIAGAEVVVVNSTYDTKFTSTSDAKGRWSVVGLASGRYKVTVTKEGYQDASVEFQLSIIAQKVHELDVRLNKQEAATIMGMTEAEGLALAALLKEGNMLYDQQQYKEALAKFEAFAKEHPKTYQVYINIGNCLLGMRQHDQALAAYQTFIDRLRSEKGDLAGDKNAAGVLATMGRIYLDQENIDRAKEYFELAIETYPADKTLPYNVGEIYFNQNKPDLAIEYLLKAVEIDKEWAPPHLKLGYAYLNRGQYKSALESFERFLKLSPDDPQAPNVTNLLPELKKLAKKE